MIRDRRQSVGRFVRFGHDWHRASRNLVCGIFWFIGSLVRWFVGSLVRWFVGSMLIHIPAALFSFPCLV
ncbi:hypothetical protein BZA05DRAFT_254881 [Tricharina praecox]|uniref:uncharacterized protein n=1 Tax=Tricharina praecox TaxID=43433 RepID=UPI00222093FF|nr:uncharacterized protein BZA05DRAFT_254881 [Tricharina praecox]KAI5854982.1 hypothetical protein BZA05DRAFT_254881 [Tricharina praecox]